MEAKVLSNLDSKKQNLSNKRFVDKIKIISDFLEWNFSVYKKKEIKDPKVDEAIFNLKKKTCFVYKNFFNKKETQDIKKNINANLKKSNTNIRKEVLYRERTVYDPTQYPFLKKIIKKKFIADLSKKFYSSNNVKFMKITYEKKIGIGEMKHEKVKKIADDYQYHADRPYGWLKFCLILKDITESNGPLCIIPETHKWPKNFYDLKYRFLTFYGNNQINPFILPTFKSNEIKKYFNVESEIKLTGKEGDLLIFNTAAYHKGDNLKKGYTREVLWFYTIFPSSFEAVKKKIKSLTNSPKN